MTVRSPDLRGTPARGALPAVALAVLFLAGCVALSPRVVTAGDLAGRLSGFVWPLPVETVTDVSSVYGPRGRRHHDGLDLRARNGAPIYASGDGTVIFSGWRGGYGNTVIVDHSGDVHSLYAHASELLVRRGERVRRGEVIARVGATGNATGPHLHFEIRWADHPLDPRAVLPRLANGD